MQDNQQITTILKIKYKQGFKKECLLWMLETAELASGFDGFIEKNICMPLEAERELLNIFTFSNDRCLLLWENSEQRIRQTKKIEAFVEAIQSKSQLTGLEFMFPSSKSPKRIKMVIVTVCVLFILLNTLAPVLQHFFTFLHLPFLLKSLLGVSVMVSLMTFVILPFFSKLLNRWLVS